jgi:hypothetical protein
MTEHVLETKRLVCEHISEGQGLMTLKILIACHPSTTFPNSGTLVKG